MTYKKNCMWTRRLSSPWTCTLSVFQHRQQQRHLHVLGVHLPDRKPTVIALQSFYGIGAHTALRLCSQLCIPPRLPLQDIPEHQITALSSVLSGMVLESDLKREIRGNIARLRRIGSWRGRRFQAGLPVRGQRTRTNAKIAKRLNPKWVYE